VSKGEISTKPTVFISYSHKDEERKDILHPYLAAFQVHGLILLWDDRKIDVGALWYNEIRDAMGRASVAVLLVSQYYLASDFINKEEVGSLLDKSQRNQLVVLPLLLSPHPAAVRAHGVAHTQKSRHAPAQNDRA